MCGMNYSKIRLSWSQSKHVIERTRVQPSLGTLLNEKKKKIRELHEILRQNNIKLSDDDVLHSTLINTKVIKDN
ncbi:BFH_collapsed_G0021230.mRNA.1.CDS.1 [Saccharomyces cerevisiae]|nr:BFH_collapsed_G0021230.mRNA.1.CDS.1 [Saccharomyces cerevisiae]